MWYFVVNMLEQRLNELEREISRNPDNWDAWQELAHEYDRTGCLPESLQDRKYKSKVLELVQQNPENIAAHELYEAFLPEKMKSRSIESEINRHIGVLFFGNHGPRITYSREQELFYDVATEEQSKGDVAFPMLLSVTGTIITGAALTYLLGGTGLAVGVSALVGDIFLWKKIFSNAEERYQGYHCSLEGCECNYENEQ